MADMHRSTAVVLVARLLVSFGMINRVGRMPGNDPMPHLFYELSRPRSERKEDDQDKEAENHEAGP